MQPKCPTNVHITAEKFKEVCLNEKNTEDNLNEIKAIIEYLFNPENDLGTPINNVAKIIDYICGGLDYNEFKLRVKCFDSSKVCGLVWSTNYVAYRCRTCGISPCMSICAECFKNGNHEGHDFNMFRSGAGGACDCGDEHVMQKSGFCKFHGPERDAVPEPPIDLIKCTEIVIPHMIYRILQYLRSYYTETEHIITVIDSIGDAQKYIEFLNELCSLGTAMRKLIVKYIINDEFYNEKLANEHSHVIKSENEQSASSSSSTEQAIKIKNYTHKTFLDLIETTEQNTSLQIPKTFEANTSEHIRFDTNQLIKRKYTNILNELLYWCIKYEFPENLVKFLLCLLPEQNYKIEFTKSFVLHYYLISNTILNHNSNYLSSRVVHISVQLFSNELITIKALNDYNLLEIFMLTLNNILTNQTQTDLIKLNDLNDSNRHYIINVDHHILQENLYWPIVSDLVNLLSHKQVAIKFLTNDNITNTWLDLIQYFQSMNLNKRQLLEHIQYEQPTYFSSFSAELEFCASILWSFIQHLTTSNEIQVTKSIINKLLCALNKWLELVNTRGGHRPNCKHLTFHLPMHRYYSIFLYNALYKQNANINEFRITDQEFLADLLAYPLQTQIGFYEIHSNLWLRNGLQMKGQAMTYIQNHFCTSFSDADLFFIQLIAAQLNEDYFMQIFFERFYVFDLCKSLKNYQKHNGANNGDQISFSQKISMLIGALTLLAQIVYIKPNLTLNDYNLTRIEIINLLCVSDRTFSQIEENLPDVCSLSTSKKDIEKILNEVADFIQPLSYEHGLKQGTYVPKEHIWLNEYDPLYVMLRSVKLREFQESFDRYCDFIKIKNLNPINKLWPPFRLLTSESIHDEKLIKKFNLLNTKSLHGILFTLLYWYLNESFLPEKGFYFVVYILELAVHTTFVIENKKPKSDDSAKIDDQVENNEAYCINEEGNYDKWFDSNNIFDNLCKNIDYIAYDDAADESSLNDSNNDEDTPRKSISFRNKLVQLPPFKKVCADTESNMPTSSTASQSPFKKEVKTYQINDSMLSLLVKIMNKTDLSKDEKSNKMAKFEFIYDDQKGEKQRSGDEHFYLSNLLKQIAKFDSKCKQTIESIMEKLNLNKKNSDQLDEDTNDDDTKRRKAIAKARQNKLMAQMASNQKAFLSRASFDDNLEADKSELESSQNEDTAQIQKSYDCCICRVSSVANSSRPLGLITFVQSSSVLGHREVSFSKTQSELNSDNNEIKQNEEICWKIEKDRINLLKDQFCADSFKYAVNIGWRGGVYTQSCGHYLHFDCYNSYKETQLTTIQTQHNFSTFSNGEYCCPLCRRIANSLLPVINYSTQIKYEDIRNKMLRQEECASFEDNPIGLITYLLKNRRAFGFLDSNSKPFVPCVNDAWTAIFEATDNDYRYIEPVFNHNTHTHADNALFLTSTLRTQLEISLMLKEYPDLCISTSVKRACFLPLFDVLSTHCRVTCAQQAPHIRIWSLLTNSETEIMGSSTSKNLPILLHDPISMLIIILSNLPSRIHKTLFKTIVSNIFNFVYVQNIFAYLLLKSHKIGPKSIKSNRIIKEKLETIEDYEIYIMDKLNNFENVANLLNKINSNNEFGIMEYNGRSNYIKSQFFKFLRIASLLQSYLYEDEFEFIGTFESLLDYLSIEYELKHNDVENRDHLVFNFNCVNQKGLIDMWLNEIFELENEQIYCVPKILQINTIEYKKADLIKLPQLYSDLFCCYSQKSCKFCFKMQKESVICLICGTHMSFRTSCCCEQMKTLNKTHLKECGTGTIMFININSTYVHILRGKRYASWASLYLDEHGEEDRDLKRGKPLFLSKQRYDLLKALWASHAFEYQNIKWFSANLFVF